MYKLAAALAALMLALSGCAFLPSGDAGVSAPKTGEYRIISMDEALEMMERETNYIILDVRTQEEFDAGHIPGAIVIPNETITDSEPALLPDKEQLIMIYCRSGNRSKQASAKLAEMGYTNIVEFGGIIDWPGDVETE